MRNETNEYSLVELLDHPGLGWVITSGGIERRCLDLMLDARSRDRRYADAETRAVTFDQHTLQ
jgi:hypothetical protein